MGDRRVTHKLFALAVALGLAIMAGLLYVLGSFDDCSLVELDAA